MEKKLIDLIKETDFFKKLEEREFINIIGNCKYKIMTYSKDEYIAFRGDEIDGLYINLEGNLVAEMLKEDGSVKKIEELKNGKIIASAFIFGDINRFPVDLVAKSNIKLLFIEKCELINILQNNLNLLVNFLDEISNKAQFLSKNLWESLSNKTINRKLAEFIIEREENGIFILEGSVKELSEYFNVSRPSLSRVIKFFIENNYIEKLEKGRYRVISLDKLRDIQ